MAILKPVQVAAAAYLGGFPPQAIPVAVAVARGESSYNTAAYNACCSGLWQIHRKAHADKIRAAGGVARLEDPVVNAKLANQIYAGDWCGGRASNGHCNKYEAYGLDSAGKSWAAKVDEGAKAYAQLASAMATGKSAQEVLGNPASWIIDGLMTNNPAEGTPIADTAGAITGSAKAIVEFGNRAGKWLGDRDNWMRVAQVVMGGFLLVAGVRIATNNQTMAALKQVSSIVPVGKAAGMMKGAK